MKRVLVTGAGGFIGRYCIDALLNQGFEVYTISHRRHVNMPIQVHHFEIDLNDTMHINELIQKVRPSHVLHLAWYTDPENYLNADGNLISLNYSLNLLRAFCSCGGWGKRFVSVGTCIEYDRRYDVRSEISTPLNGDSLYAAAKTSLFRLCSTYCAKHGVSYAHARPFYMFGVGENEKRIIPHIMRNLLNGQSVKVSHGEQIRDYLYIADVGAALAAITASDIEGAINIGSGQGIKLRQLFTMIELMTGRKGLVQLGAVSARIGEPDAIIADNHRLLLETDWKQSYTIEEGLNIMYRAMQNQ